MLASLVCFNYKSRRLLLLVRVRLRRWFRSPRPKGLPPDELRGCTQHVYFGAQLKKTLREYCLLACPRLFRDQHQQDPFAARHAALDVSCCGLLMSGGGCLEANARAHPCSAQAIVVQGPRENRAPCLLVETQPVHHERCAHALRLLEIASKARHPGLMSMALPQTRQQAQLAEDT